MEFFTRFYDELQMLDVKIIARKMEIFVYDILDLFILTIVIVHNIQIKKKFTIHRIHSRKS